MTELDSRDEYNVEAFHEGKSIGHYETSEDGDKWEHGAFSETVHSDQNNGVDIVGGTSEDYLFIVETKDARDVNLDSLEGAEQSVEYQVEVDVFDRNMNQLYEGETATIVSGTPSDVSAEEWANHSVTSALSDYGPDIVEGAGSGQGSEIKDLMPGNEAEPTGLDAIDSI